MPHSDASRLELRAYTPGDEKSICELFEITYGRPLPLEHWKWRFQDNPAGHGIIELAWDGDILAGHYAVNVIAMRIEGTETLTGLSGTTMTHPNYRGQGLFPKLANSTYARMADAGMAMVWGFPNVNSHRGFNKNLGWIDIHEVPTLSAQVSRLDRLQPSDGSVTELTHIDARFDQLWQKIKNEYSVISKRAAENLNWRYSSNPTETYRILAYLDGENVDGYVIFKRYKDQLQVIDLFASAVEIGISLVSHLAQIGREDLAQTIDLWFNVNHPLHWALEKYSFANHEPITYLGVLSLRSSGVDIYDFRNWYLTMGDSDVY